MTTPTHGFTKHGHPVHAKTADHLPADTRLQRLNKRVAVGVTGRVGTMWCAYLFCLLALVSLPAILTEAGWVKVFPHWMIAPGLVLIVAWVAQTFIQLVLLSVIMVGQSVQATASDARAAKTLEDIEKANLALSLEVDGGLKTVLDEVKATRVMVRTLGLKLDGTAQPKPPAVSKPTVTKAPAKKVPAKRAAKRAS